MKFLKLSLLTLFVAVVVDVALVYAYPSPSMSIVLMELKGTNSQTTTPLTKNIIKAQSYKTTSNITWLNNPCGGCEISTKLSDSNTVVTVMGQTKEFNDHSGFLRDYDLTIKRHNSTLLTTHHAGDWYINS